MVLTLIKGVTTASKRHTTQSQAATNKHILDQAPPQKEAVQPSLFGQQAAANVANKTKQNGETKVTENEVKQALQDVAAIHGLDKISAIVQKYGARRIGDLDQSKYAAVITEARAL